MQGSHERFVGQGSMHFPKGPCAQMECILDPKHLYSDYLKAEVYTTWAHGPLGSSSYSGPEVFRSSRLASLAV